MKKITNEYEKKAEPDKQDLSERRNKKKSSYISIIIISNERFKFRLWWTKKCDFFSSPLLFIIMIIKHTHTHTTPKNNWSYITTFDSEKKKTNGWIYIDNASVRERGSFFSYDLGAKNFVDIFSWTLKTKKFTSFNDQSIIIISHKLS